VKLLTRLLTRLLAAINRPDRGRGRGICPSCGQLVDLYFVHGRQADDGTVYRCDDIATGGPR